MTMGDHSAAPDGAHVIQRLAEFTLARIAEDEVALPAIGDSVEFVGDQLIDWPERVARECKAKRSMVGLLQADAADPGNAMRRVWAAEILRGLASIYADHPDFRDEWLHV